MRIAIWLIMVKYVTTIPPNEDFPFIIATLLGVSGLVCFFQDFLEIADKT